MSSWAVQFRSVVCGVAVAVGAAAGERLEFNRDIRPILADKCFACHGPDANRREADLRLDTAAGALAARDGRPALVPGKPAASELYRRLTTADADERMPPESSKKSITAEQIERIRRWIEEGGRFQPHWSLIPPRRPSVPTADLDWADNPIDQFVAAAHQRQGLRPSADADARTLVRRLFFDLLGLPPSPEEIDAHAWDDSPTGRDAATSYESLVDRLLASPHFGERMAMYWLDVVRYADSGGYHSDNERSVYPYRDYVIRSFNDNLPFDQFTLEQIAGDLLPDASFQQKVASGYNRLLQTTEEGGAQPKEYAAKYLADRVRNTATAWLATTLGCCECHDHKYDSFSTQDFYRFGAFFADVQEKAVGRQDPSPIPTPEQEVESRRLDAELERLREAIARGGAQAVPLQRELAAIEQRRQALQKAFPLTLVSISVAPRTVRVLPRGNWLDESGEIVEPATPQPLPPVEIPDRRTARLALGRWLGARHNPLTARVFVNRLWKLFFGQGIVRTMDDFGTQGSPPTHPELLDWLAVDFMEHGWNVKHTIKLMVMSRTYRQTSSVTAERRRGDPLNQWLTRQSSFRLDAELVRDNALAISGLLARRIGGPGVKPYQPVGYWRFLNFPTREWVNDKGENLYRRGLYTHWQRTFLHPSLLAFDAPSREECTVERPRSNTPLQALALLNDPTYVEAARALAVRVLDEGGMSTAQRLNYAYRLSLSRQPTEPESELLAALLAKHRQDYETAPESAQSLLSVGDWRVPDGKHPAEVAAWTSVARVLLNLHETMTRE